MPLRWSLADPVASVAINMPLQKELFATSRLPRRRVQGAYKQRRHRFWAADARYKAAWRFASRRTPKMPGTQGETAGNRCYSVMGQWC